MTYISMILYNRYIVGCFVITIVILTLSLDILGLVHPCPYCRIQRASLGILSIILLTKWYSTLAARFVAVLVGAYGIIVGVTQNFNHVRKINKGEFDWSALRIDHPWILSGLAVIALVWLIFLILDLPKHLGKDGDHPKISS